MNTTDIKTLLRNELSDIHTCLPGVIVSYDGQLATVRPGLDKLLGNGQSLSAPQIVKVPVCWPVGDINGGKALITVPLKAGDNVLLNFSERCLESWLTGSNGAPDDPRQFDLSDCFATPMLRPNTLKADTENVSIEYGPMSMKIAPDGTVTVKNTTQVIFDTPLAVFEKNVQIKGTARVEDHFTFMNGFTGYEGTYGETGGFYGTIRIRNGNLIHTGGQLSSNGIVLDTHRHSGVATGSGQTGGPV